MASGHAKPIIGLCGGIGAGKSTVAEEFAKLGCAVISADALNHEILARPEIVEEIRQWWGQSVIAGDGTVNRRALGDLLFDNPEEMKRLTDLLHPVIAERQQELIAAYEQNASVKAVVLDVPLLFEVGQDRLCDTVVFVAADEKSRWERLKKRGWTAEKAKNAQNLQLSLDMKAKMSEYTVGNNSCIPDLAVQVDRVFTEISRRFFH